MFFMCLEIDRDGWPQESTIVSQPEIEDEDDELDNEYDINLEEVQDVIEILFFICNKLEESNLVRFRVEGFGEVKWPVDVKTDFEIVLEQISDLLRFLAIPELSNSCLEFYEQGTQRKLVFLKIDSLIQINCYKTDCYVGSLESSWGQDIEEEPLEPAFLKNMICNLIRNFVSIANELCPEWTAHELFQEWCREHYISSCLQN
jgi:hypothetical protein